jgi:PKD repeat protein
MQMAKLVLRMGLCAVVTMVAVGCDAPSPAGTSAVGAPSSSVESGSVRSAARPLRLNADFDAVCVESSCQFTDTSSGPLPITSWSWDFNDGSGSSEQNPTHVYLNQNTNFFVTLTVTDSAGATDSHRQVVHIRTRGRSH